MSKVWKQLPFGLHQFEVDRSHRYTDSEITDIIDNRLGRGDYDGWDYLAGCATDPEVRKQCEHFALSAKWAEEF